MYGPALPVAGHTEWLAFLASPPAEQRARYEAHRQYMIDILDGLDADPLSDEGAWHIPGSLLLCAWCAMELGFVLE